MKISELSELSEKLIDVSDVSDGSVSELNGQLIIADVSGSVNLADFRKDNFYTVEQGIQALEEKDLSLEVMNAICSLFFKGKRPPFTCTGAPATCFKPISNPFLTGTRRAHGR